MKGKRHGYPAYRDVERLRPGKHHYLVQFIGPIKDAWLKSLREIGVEPRQHYENFAYVVRASGKLLPNGAPSAGGQDRGSIAAVEEARG